jgi:hypothetical protein
VEGDADSQKEPNPDAKQPIWLCDGPVVVRLWSRSAPSNRGKPRDLQGLSRGSVKVDNSYDFASFLSFALAKSDIEVALEVLSAELAGQLTGR